LTIEIDTIRSLGGKYLRNVFPAQKGFFGFPLLYTALISERFNSPCELIKTIEKLHENHREKAGCGIMRRKNGNKEPLPAIQTTIEFHTLLYSSLVLLCLLQKRAHRHSSFF
jgi:hypothetical protein